MKKQSKHTPGPFEIKKGNFEGSDIELWGSNGRKLATIKTYSKEDEEFIFQAVNLYEEILSASKTALLEIGCNLIKIGGNISPAYEQLKAAIAKAEGK